MYTLPINQTYTQIQQMNSPYTAKASNISNSENKKNGKLENYFAYLSKCKTNRHLKTAKGRETQDGMFRFTKMMTAAGSVVTGLIGAFIAVSAKDIRNELYNPKAQPADVSLNDSAKFAKFTKRSKLAKIFIGTAAVLGLVALYIDQINDYFADKTANKRGFPTDRQNNISKNLKQAYEDVDKIYNENIK